MNREKLFQSLSGLDDRYIAESAAYTPEGASGPSERIIPMKKKRILTLALAAALLIALGASAFALYGSMSWRTPEPEESYRINWEESASGYVEWTDAKLAVTFPETAESREIEFRPGWLPYELPAVLGGSDPGRDLGSDSWFRRLTSETLAFADGAQAVPAYADMMQPLLIETYYMPMFNDGGALLLLYYTPEHIIEEHWDEQGVDVLRFHCVQHLEAVPEFDMPERTLEEDIILLADPEAGWVVRICGEIGMDQLLKVAKHLEIRETGRILTSADFPDRYTFMDGGVG